jgi:hypothetical protein
VLEDELAGLSYWESHIMKKSAETPDLRTEGVVTLQTLLELTFNFPLTGYLTFKAPSKKARTAGPKVFCM